MSYWILIKPFLKYIIPFIIGGILVGGTVWKIHKYKVGKLEGQVSICKDANAENTKTITALQAEIAKGNKTCEQRLKSKQGAINRLREIDDLKGASDGKKVGTDSNDPVLNQLRGMFGNK
ncbi:MAG: hypothetical protein ABFD82_00645 [Syntrophaceae bacterium]